MVFFFTNPPRPARAFATFCDNTSSRDLDRIDMHWLRQLFEHCADEHALERILNYMFF